MIDSDQGARTKIGYSLLQKLMDGTVSDENASANPEREGHGGLQCAA